MSKKNFTDLEELIQFVLTYLRSDVLDALSHQPTETGAGAKAEGEAAALELAEEIANTVEISSDPDEASKVALMLAYEAIERLRYPAYSNSFENMFASDNPDINTDMEVPPDAVLNVSQETLNKAAANATLLDAVLRRKTQ